MTEILDLSTKKVMEAIGNNQEYENWWLVPVTIPNPKANYFEFKPVFYVTIGIRITRNEKRQVRYDYVKGPFRGYGIWYFESLGSQETKVTYEVLLKPIHWMYQLVGNTNWFKNKHSKDIQELLREIR